MQCKLVIRQSVYHSFKFCDNVTMFQTSNINVVKFCQSMFSFRLPSELLDARIRKFVVKYRDVY